MHGQQNIKRNGGMVTQLRKIKETVERGCICTALSNTDISRSSRNEPTDIRHRVTEWERAQLPRNCIGKITLVCYSFTVHSEPCILVA